MTLNYLKSCSLPGHPARSNLQAFFAGRWRHEKKWVGGFWKKLSELGTEASEGAELAILRCKAHSVLLCELGSPGWCWIKTDLFLLWLSGFREFFFWIIIRIWMLSTLVFSALFIALSSSLWPVYCKISAKARVSLSSQDKSSLKTNTSLYSLHCTASLLSSYI